jgi:hypothetical protein
VFISHRGPKRRQDEIGGILIELAGVSPKEASAQVYHCLASPPPIGIAQRFDVDVAIIAV